MFWLYEGTRFLHDVLWDQKIRHEFHFYLGEDHVGHSMGRRTDGGVRVPHRDACAIRSPIR